MKLIQLLEQSLEDLHKLANEFKREFDTPKGEEEWGDKLSTLCDEPGNCSMISHTFGKWLSDKGIKSSHLTGHGAINPKWKIDDEDAHTVVKVGSFTIDFNARQFDKSLPYPRVISVDQFKTEWKRVD